MSKAPCPICGCESAHQLVARERVPVFQNAVYRSAEAAREAATASIDFRKCRQCGFVWNAAFDPAVIDYSGDYNNSQTASRAFQDHLSERVTRILSALPDKDKVTIVEVGCGQGDFLATLADAVPAGRRLRAYGFDPAYRGDTALPEGFEIWPAYFTAESAARLPHAPDIIVSRHTIEHVPDPVGFLQAIRATLPQDASASLFVETPDHTWILENEAFQDFFYEHCSLFDFSSMGLALQKSGFAPTRIERCFNGQYLWAEAQAGPDFMHAGGAKFAARGAAFHDHWQRQLQRVSQPVVLWGAGAKGATFAMMMDPDCALINCVVDANPDKAGGHIPMTGHRVVSPQSLKEAGVGTIIVMNPNYLEEIRQQLAELGLAPKLIALDA